MTSAVHEQRQALGLRLRELRRDAGLTGRALARSANWPESKISKLEYGRQTPTEEDLRTWCDHTGSCDQLPDLIATLRNIEAAYMEWRRALGIGTRRHQRRLDRVAQAATRLYWYEPLLIPGLLQTPGYIEAVLRKMIKFYGIPDDLDDGVEARVERQKILHHGNRRFSFVIAEQALQTTVGSESIMLGQLEYLLATMSLPRLVLGIVPEQAALDGPAINGFVMYDNRLVLVETVSAELRINQPREIALYAKLFALLSEQALYGEPGRALIRKAIETRT
ncbi:MULTISPECIES: helix-turn-helix transcriptional regulator [unclassified Nocardia]|uniref:helix-turn-helix domain-containing protein n=1 Tax=unclassified Nocardia TaxID=2637762 RepID=UPI00278BD854|nr:MULTISPECIES: helix-turn-helix transcriptional regulator [unclassified Nocardia]